MIQTQYIDNARTMESLGLFAGGIAHDFNNILMGIMGNTSLLINSIDKINNSNSVLSDIGKAFAGQKH